MEAAGIQLSPLGPTNYLNVPSFKMSVIWSLRKHSTRSPEDASQILHFFGEKLEAEMRPSSTLLPFPLLRCLSSISVPTGGGVTKFKAVFCHKQSSTVVLKSLWNKMPDFLKKLYRTRKVIKTT